MEYETYKQIMQGLGTAYNRNFNEAELRLFFRYFREYEEDVFMEAIDKAITSYDRMPSIKQLVDNCEIARTQVRLRKEYEALPPITEEDRREFQEILDSFK